MDKENIQLLALTLFGICGFFLFVLLLVFYDLDQHDDDGRSSTGRPCKNHYNQQSKDKLSEDEEFDNIIHDHGLLDVYNYDYDHAHPDLTCAVDLNDVPNGHPASINGLELPADISISSFNGVARGNNELDSCRFIRKVSVDQLMELDLLHEGHSARSYTAFLDGRELVVVKKFSTNSNNATAAKVDCELYTREKSIYETIVSASHGTNQHDGFTEHMVGIKAATYCCNPHLVALLGYCEDGDERLLVFEHVAGHGSLAQVIASSRCLSSNIVHQKVNSVHPATEGGWPINVLPLPWIIRLKIAIGVAQALAFLHHKGISHRNVKASNILLSEDYMPKLGSLSKAQAIKDQGKPLCDIYCFGKVLLDLISGLDISGGNADDARQAWMLRALALMSMDHPNQKNKYTRALPLMPSVEIILGPRHGRQYGNCVDGDIITTAAENNNDNGIHGNGDDHDNDNGCNHDGRRHNHNRNLTTYIQGHDHSHDHGHDDGAVQKNQASRDRLLLELMKDPSLVLEADMAEEAMGVALIANACLNIRVLHRLSMDTILQLLKNPASAHHYLRQLQYCHN